MLGELTQVTQIADKPVFLDDFLRPLWKMLRFSGLYHNFLSSIKENRGFYIIRSLSTILVILLVTNFGVFQLTQLVIRLPNRKSIADISLNMLISVCCLLAVIFLHQFYTKHNQLVEFFKNWKQAEMQFSDSCNRGRTGRIAKVVKALFFLITVSCPFMTLYWNLGSPDESVFFSHLQIFQDNFSLIFLAFLFSVSMYFTVMFIVLIEIIPPVIFYLAGCSIENLNQELQNLSTSVHNRHSSDFRNKNLYLLIWKNYESVRRLVKRANQLFGVMIIANQFCYVFVACSHIYLVIIVYEKDLSLEIFVINIIFTVARTIGSNWLFSHLRTSCCELKSAVADLLSKKWDFLAQEQRNILTSFLIRLDKRDAVARPLNLYDIDPTNLLSLLTVLISYVIVLLQVT